MDLKILKENKPKIIIYCSFVNITFKVILTKKKNDEIYSFSSDNKHIKNLFRLNLFIKEEWALEWVKIEEIKKGLLINNKNLYKLYSDLNLLVSKY